MTKLIDIRMDNFINGIKKGVPVTLGFTLETDGAPPPVGSRLEFRAYKDVTLLHASMPVNGAQMFFRPGYYDSSMITITDVQTQGWNPKRTLTLISERDLGPSSVAELCAIIYYQPAHMVDLYCAVLATGIEEQNIQVRQTFNGAWQDQATKGWVYSYELILRSTRHSIAQWKISTAGLPQGTKIYANPWLDITHDGTEGIIELRTPEGDKYLLEPDTDLPVSVQLLYPVESGQDPSFQNVPNLVAYPL
ncbi:hypothetical protein BK659_06620 [Pseudomonas brassicacearum]|uniref:Uncharacterized protein n=1 Tax=Pseudomonas brassicacearum TaxID=930166 RepID=A0A423HB47_9PSED|nr:hypothetical protein [Pseudomonas brassicacearum]RON10412.1 hypothetical protein BK659_06620 [Pseudomonas brassicacearum]